MRVSTIRRPCAFLLASGCLSLLTAQGTPTLNYVDSSVGLDQPGLEGGDTEVKMADLNGDGHVDLISIGDHGNPQINTAEHGIMVWFGNGLGGWSLFQDESDLGYGGIAVGDVNGDGLQDVGYAMHHNYSADDLGDQYIEVSLGDGTGTTWTPWDDGLAQEGQDWGMFATDFADVDGDGDLDVGSTSFGADDGMHIYFNDENGTWRRSYGFIGGNSGHVFDFGDVDGDGLADIVTAKDQATVWLGDGEGFFRSADGNLPVLPELDYRRGPSLGDVNGDGQDDLAYCDSTANAQVWLWRGDDTWEDVSAGLPGTGTCQRTRIRDMDGDGHQDIVTFGDRNVYVFGGDGTGATWVELAHFTTPENIGDAKAFQVGGDVDHNGFPDIVLVDNKTVSIFSDQNVLRCFRESSSPSSLSVRVFRPGPDRMLLAGSVRFIEWAAAVFPGETGSVTLELSTSGPGGPWETIASGLPNHGRYQWTVPPRITEDAHVRVTVETPSGSATAVSGGPFRIRELPDPVTLLFDTRDDVRIVDGLGRDRLNLYRSDWQRFLDTGEYTQDPVAVPQAEQFCDLPLNTVSDPFVPGPGTLVFYLASGYRMMEDGLTPGVPVPMAEGNLGQRTGAVMRDSSHRCPQ